MMTMMMILCLFMKVECQRRSSLLRVDPLVGRQALNRLLQQEHDDDEDDEEDDKDEGDEDEQEGDGDD